LKQAEHFRIANHFGFGVFDKHMKISVWSVGLLALALPVVSCEKREAAPATGVSSGGKADAVSSSEPAAPSQASPATAVKATGATIDLQKVMAETPPAIEARQRIEAARNEVKGEIDERRKRIQALGESVATSAKRLQNPALTTPEREALVKEANARRSEVAALEKELKEFAELRDKALNEKTRAELGKVIRDIHQRASIIAKTEGYVWVMDRSGESPNRVPAVVYVKPSLPDLTPAVIQAINQEAAKEAPAK
jgi:Skp family chaperone for outer membrane proteins